MCNLLGCTDQGATAVINSKGELRRRRRDQGRRARRWPSRERQNWTIALDTAPMTPCIGPPTSGSAAPRQLHPTPVSTTAGDQPTIITAVA